MAVVEHPLPRAAGGGRPSEPDRSAQFFGAMRVVAGLTVASRVAGLARDAVCSRVFGLGPVWSAFSVAFLIPNTFRRLFGEGALSAAFIPEYAHLLKRDPALARRFASAVMAALIFALCLLTLAGEALLLFLLKATPLGESGGLAIRLTMVMLPYMPLVCAAAILAGVMQTHGSFAPGAASPIILNLCTIAVASVWAWGLRRPLEESIWAVSWSVTISGVIQLVWSLISVSRHERWTSVFAGVRAPFGRLYRRIIPVAVGMGAVQINTLIDGVIASWPVVVGSRIRLPGVGEIAYPMDEASASALFFAQRIYQFPLGVFGVALATVALPALAREADDRFRFDAILRRGVRSALFIGLAATVGLLAVGRDLVSLVLGGGRFDAADVERTAPVLFAYSTAIWAFVAAQTLTRSFYARGDTRTPMLVSLASVVVNLLLNLTLIWPLRETGLAWSTSIAATLQFAALAVIAARQGRPERLFDGDVVRSVAWSAGLAAAMGGVLAVLSRVLPAAADGDHRVEALRVAVMVIAGAAVFLGGAAIARRPEAAWMLERRPADKPSSSREDG